MKTKRKGNRSEHKTMTLLEASGYRCTRSGASLGDWDVIGVGPTDVVLVQVKSNTGPRSLERMALLDFKVPTNVKKLIHVWKDRKRLPNVEEL